MSRISNLAVSVAAPKTHGDLYGPKTLFLMSAIVLAGFWFWGDVGLLTAALGFPLVVTGLATVLPKQVVTPGS